jgi:hypothetical protein
LIWEEKTYLALGQAGCIRFLADKGESDHDPSKAEALFYILHSALLGGLAWHLEVKYETTRSSFDLWMALGDVYNTNFQHAEY